MQDASLIIDVTYRCNARCIYCRWGDGQTARRRDIATHDLCVDVSVLRAAHISRVVLSGGEPLLHAGLNDVLGHYARAGVLQRVVITNGLLATSARIASCRDHGATGFAFSIDSVDPVTALATRAMTPTQIHMVLTHLAGAGRYAREHRRELTVNCVLSAANCVVSRIRELAMRSAACGASAIKLQPVFDDGYLGVNAPALRLGPQHADEIRAMGEDAETWGIATNPPAFFDDLALVCEGSTLDGRSCGLGERIFVLQGGGLVVCPWVGSRPIDTALELPVAVRDFHSASATCGTGPHCFCLQPREHRWRFRDAVG